MLCTAVKSNFMSFLPSCKKMKTKLMMMMRESMKHTHHYIVRSPSKRKEISFAG